MKRQAINQDGGGRSVVLLRFVSKVKSFYILAMRENMKKEEEQEGKQEEEQSNMDNRQVVVSIWPGCMGKDQLASQDGDKS